jgi:HAD superfamily hydrolase (TIGR01662 family)
MVMNAPIRALLFDVGNTLLQINHTAIAEMLAAHGHAVTPEAVYEAECHARLTLDFLIMRGAEPANIFKGYFQALCAHLGLSWNRQTRAALDAIRAYDRQHSLWNQAVPWSQQALRALQEAGYFLGVISNSDGTVAELLARQGLDRFFKFILDSYIVGVEKPAPRIFRMALDYMQTAPQETVYIGDLYHVDVEGARGVGMHGILVDPVRAWRTVACPKIRNLRHLPSLLRQFSPGVFRREYVPGVSP